MRGRIYLSGESELMLTDEVFQWIIFMTGEKKLMSIGEFFRVEDLCE